MGITKVTQKPILLFKYGGNAMINNDLKKSVLDAVCSLRKKHYQVVIVHGGGPFIKAALEEAAIESEFIDGHRITTTEAFQYVEMALKGKVNSDLVGLINSLGFRAVGLSGKDGQIVTAAKRRHQSTVNGVLQEVDLGQVGDVDRVDTTLIELLLENDFIPVITCLATDSAGNGFNINGDMFAGHIAGALKAQQYIVLTDVDGLLRDRDNPATRIPRITVSEIDQLVIDGIIQHGMLPKMESCKIAISNGAESARIINGTKPEQIQDVSDDAAIGTLITQ